MLLVGVSLPSGARGVSHGRRERQRRLKGGSAIEAAGRRIIAAKASAGDAAREARLRALVRQKRESKSANELEEDAARVMREASVAQGADAKDEREREVREDEAPRDPDEFKNLVSPLQVIAAMTALQNEIADASKRGDEDAAYYLELKLGRLASKL